jgi:outer membrane protein
VYEQFSAALSALMQARGLATAVSSGELALRANRRGYESGTRVMAEVLDAQSKLFETQRDLTRARYDAWLSLLRLRALAGRLGEEDFRALEALLVAVPRELPVRAPNRERGRP